MTPEQFIMVYGWDEAHKAVYNPDNKSAFYTPLYSPLYDLTMQVDVYLPALLKLVEQWEIVEQYGGVKEAKKWIKTLPSEEVNSVEVKVLKQAINVVQSIKVKGSE